ALPETVEGDVERVLHEVRRTEHRRRQVPVTQVRLDELLAAGVRDIAVDEAVGAAYGRVDQMDAELRGDVDEQPALGYFLVFAAGSEGHREAEHGIGGRGRGGQRGDIG